MATIFTRGRWVVVVSQNRHTESRCRSFISYHVLCGRIPSLDHGAHGAQGPVSVSEKTSYRKISWSLEAARFVFIIVRSLWNLTGTPAALLPMCLSNFKAIRQFKVPISWLRDFTRCYDKTSFRILRRGPDDWCAITSCVMAKHGLRISGISTDLQENLARDCFTPTQCKISFPFYIIMTNKLMHPLTTTWHNSLVL